MIPKPVNLLVVEDNQIDVFLAKSVLEEAGHLDPLSFAENGQLALDYLQNQENPLPTIILLDLNMPVMDGFEFLDAFAKLRVSNHRYDNVSVVICSSSRHEQDKECTLAFAFVKGYIEKPITQSLIEPYL
jgi:CheY-like chemotaxis protein